MRFNGEILSSDNYLETLKNVVTDSHLERILVVTSPSFRLSGELDKVVNMFEGEIVHCFSQVKPNPEVGDIESLINQYLTQDFDAIVALGGGSVMDTAKVVAYALAVKTADLSAVLTKIANERAQLPLICIPTTSGTGAEVTPFATVWDSQTQTKFSFNGVTANQVILDPRLTLSLPKNTTLYTALDALSHALESIWNKNADFISRAYAERAINLVCDNLPRVLEAPDNISARVELQQAAVLAGLAISTTKTAIAHALSYPLTLAFKVPHGLACSFTLPAILNQLPPEQLKLPVHLADNLNNLFEKLDLANEVNLFASKQAILDELNCDLDPSRAGNYIGEISAETIRTIIDQSL